MTDKNMVEVEVALQHKLPQSLNHWLKVQAALECVTKKTLINRILSEYRDFQERENQ